MEMWDFRRLYRISWTDKISINTVLKFTGIKRELLKLLEKGRWQRCLEVHDRQRPTRADHGYK